MYYDESGNPSPTGRYEMINGSLRLRKSYVLQNGEHFGFNVNAMDAAPGSGGAVMIHDSPNVSPEAKFILDRIERDRAEHERKFGFMGDRMPSFDAARSAFLARNELKANPLGGTQYARPEARKMLAAGRYS
jgi:hypothetical protein